MKTFSRRIQELFAIIFLLAISSGAHASENMEVIAEENSRVIRIKMLSPTSETMDVTLFNDRNKVIQMDIIEEVSNFEHSYDLSGFEDGTYTLVSEMANMHFHRVLEVRGSGVKLADSYYTFNPVFKMEDDKVLVHYINNGTKDIGISIEQGSEILYDSYYGNDDQVFSKAFAIGKLAIGNYTLRLVTQGEFHSFEFEVD